MGEFHSIADFTSRAQDKITTTDPSVTDDASLGYIQTSRWYNTTTQRQWVCYSATVGAAVWREIYPYSSYGSEVDGNLTFDGVSTVNGWAPDGFGAYTATGPIVCGKITMLGTSRLKMANHFFDCKWLYVAAGASVDWDGNDASGLSAGAAVTAAGTIFAAMGGGGNGRSSTGIGIAGGGSGGSNIAGSASGAGGDADGTNVGGAGSASASIAANIGRTFHRAGYANVMRVWNGNVVAALNTSAGGGGGGTNIGTGTATSGGGGGAGGVGVCRVGKWEVYGRVTARGGKGAAAVASGNGKAGGGGGGSGGALHIECDEVVSMGTIDCAGGVPGTGVGGGTSGLAGTVGLVVFLKTQRGS